MTSMLHYKNEHSPQFWCSPHQNTRRWENCLQVMPQPPPPTGLCSSKTHSATQPHTPEYPPQSQLSPNPSRLYRHRLNPHQLEKRVSDWLLSWPAPKSRSYLNPKVHPVPLPLAPIPVPAGPCPHFRWNSTALLQSPPACKNMKDLFPDFAPTPKTHWTLSRQDTPGCQAPCTWTSPNEQPSPTTPEDYKGTDTNHTSWKSSRLYRSRCKPQELEEQEQTQATPVRRNDGYIQQLKE